MPEKRSQIDRAEPSSELSTTMISPGGLRCLLMLARQTASSAHRSREQMTTLIPSPLVVDGCARQSNRSMGRSICLARSMVSTGLGRPSYVARSGAPTAVSRAASCSVANSTASSRSCPVPNGSSSAHTIRAPKGSAFHQKTSNTISSSGTAGSARLKSTWRIATDPLKSERPGLSGPLPANDHIRRQGP